MRPAKSLLLFVLIATGGCSHPSYGRTPMPATPTDTLNGEPRSHASPTVPDQPARGEPDAPPPPP